jgi:hypothetical protein
MGGLRSAEPGASTEGEVAMNLGVELFVIGVICFVTLVINVMVQKSPLLKAISAGLSALGILLVIAALIQQRYVAK